MKDGVQNGIEGNAKLKARILPFIPPPAIAAEELIFSGEFEKKAAAFLRGEYDARAFLVLCNHALDCFETASPQPETSEKTVYTYRYLAHVALKLYFEAALDAAVIHTVFHDEAHYHELMFTLYLKRANLENALKHLDALLRLHTGDRQRAVELESYRAELLKAVKATLRSHPERFREKMSRYGGRECCRVYAGVRIMLTGEAKFLQHPETGAPYVVFYGKNGEKDIFCQLHDSEMPFVRRHKKGPQVSVCGYLLNSTDSLYLLHPCNLVE